MSDYHVFVISLVIFIGKKVHIILASFKLSTWCAGKIILASNVVRNLTWHNGVLMMPPVQTAPDLATTVWQANQQSRLISL